MPDRDLIGSPDEPDRPSGVQMPDRGAHVPVLRAVADALRTARRHPVIVILILAGIGDGVSGNPVHSALLVAVAIGLAFAGEGRSPVASRQGPADARAVGSTGANAWIRPLVALGVVTYAVIVGGFGRYSWPATAAVIVPGAAALVVAWRRPASPAAEGRLDPAGPTVWASLLIALGLFELLNLLLQPTLTTDSYAHPTLSVLTDPVLATHPGRSVALLAWLAGGWFLAGR